MLTSDICIIYNMKKSNQSRQDMLSDAKAKKDSKDLKSAIRTSSQSPQPSAPGKQGPADNTKMVSMWTFKQFQYSRAVLKVGKMFQALDKSRFPIKASIACT